MMWIGVLSLMMAPSWAFSSNESCSFAKSLGCESRSVEKSLLSLEGPNVTCSPVVQDSTLNPASSARAVMAMVYGSCEVLKLPPREELEPSSIPKGYFVHRYKKPRVVPQSKRAALAKAHPYYQTFFNEPNCLPFEGCRRKNKGASCSVRTCNLLKNPPIYQYGLSATDPTQKFSGMDCSSFVSMALGWAGIPLEPKGKVGGRYGTYVLSQLGKDSPRDCFDRLSFEDTPKSGDIWTLSGNHTVMFEQVGSDPFRLNQFLDAHFPDDQIPKPDDLKRACALWSERVENYDLRIIHSANHGNSVGVQIQKAIPGLGSWSSNAPFKNALMLSSRRSCISRFSSQFNIKVEQSRIKSKVSMIRAIPTRSGCQGKPVRKHESCVSCCQVDAMKGGEV